MVPEVRVLSFLLGLALLWFPLDSHARARPDLFCLFHEKRYSPGESWHPYLEPQGVMYCLRCTCSETAHVNCYQLRCPPVHCPQPVLEPQQCCPRCVEPHTPSGLRAPPKSCQHNGTMYQHGEIFSVRELFPGRLPNQCVLCSCTEGQIYCGLMTCPEPGCPAPFPLPDSCCQACKDGVSEKPAGEDPAQSQRGPRRSQDPCSSEGGRKRGPGTPAPTGPSSPLGFISHRHFRPKGPGSTIVKIVLKDTHNKEDRADPGHSEISSTRCPKAPSRVLIHTSVSPSPGSLHRFALEHEASDQVEIYLWKLVKGIFHLVQIKKVRKQDFQKEAQNFRLLTSTHEGYWNIFLAQTPELKVTASPDKATKTL
ncbi:chordin-like protein 2 isoform X5 [Heterocephalus glaber]|uniref:Chordin-like protein 2 isoform X5 n=1 Tax=Heterocephalus glaber TaxID=10181 RepID=A0AAX6RQC1_HETGA|nr:chordin-like protein 2 isoform X5 [Heterocephalus glaber]